MTAYAEVIIDGSYRIAVSGRHDYEAAITAARAHEVDEIAWHQARIDAIDAGKVRVVLVDGNTYTDIPAPEADEEAEGQDDD